MNALAAVSDGATPTLELRQFSVRPTAEWAAPLDLRTTAQRVALVGDWEPLLRVLSGRAEVASGHANVLGCALEEALFNGILGFAACDPSLPASFTVSEYLLHAARLTHGSPSRAQHDTQRVLERYGLSALAKRKLGELALFQKRALGVALATVTEPAVTLLESPLRGLDAASADYIARLCAEAAQHSRLLLTADLPSSPSSERSLLDSVQELFVVERGELIAQGAPSSVFAAGFRYGIRVKGQNIDDFSNALRARGVKVEGRAEYGRFRVELPQASGESSDLLLDTALEHGLVVLELEPIFVA